MPSTKRYHIQDTIAATIEEYGNSVELSNEDVTNLRKLTKKKTEIVKEVIFKDTEYGVVVKITQNNQEQDNRKVQELSKNFSWTNIGEGFWEGLGYKKPDIQASIRFDVVFHHKETGNYGRATYAVYKTGGVWRLSFIGNPTTLINGHNSGPVALKDKPGFYENMELYRVGFNFFFKTLEYVPSSTVAEAIKNGLIALQNTQIAIYVPSVDKGRDLGVLKLLYCRWLIGDPMKNNRQQMIGELLGIKPIVSTDDDMPGVMLRGYSARNPTYTVNFYDKAASNKMKKRRGVSSNLKETLNSSLRVDITLHRRMIEQLAGVAYTEVKKKVQLLENRNKKVNSFYYLFMERMKKGSASSALVICMIMHVLPKEESFAKFLLKRLICEEMLLDKIVNVTQARLEISQDNVNDDLWAIYTAWKTCKTSEQWIEARKKLRKEYVAKGRGEKSFYRNIKELESLTGTSLSVPFIFWANTVVLDGVYGLSNKEVERCSFLLDRERGNNLEKEIGLDREFIELQRKGREKMKKRRKYMAKTFLAPIGLDIS